jgi:hypothetical protein
VNPRLVKIEWTTESGQRSSQCSYKMPGSSTGRQNQYGRIKSVRDERNPVGDGWRKLTRRRSSARAEANKRPRQRHRGTSGPELVPAPRIEQAG